MEDSSEMEDVMSFGSGLETAVCCIQEKIQEASYVKRDSLILFSLSAIFFIALKLFLIHGELYNLLSSFRWLLLFMLYPS